MLTQEARSIQLPSDDFFLARQPILGRNQHLVAFELLFRSADTPDAIVIDQAAATASVISHASQLGMQHVCGKQLAFVNVDEIVLMSDFVRFLPHQQVILEILETVQATPAILARVAELRAFGFKFALDDVIADSDDVSKLVELVDIIKIDIQGVAAAGLASLVGRFKGPGKKLLAEKVETIDEFNSCMALGFEYFQGYYFARPYIMSGKKIAPSKLVILNLLQLITTDAANRDIELAVKHDPMIALNLLRLVNSAAAGARRHIETVADALFLLGRAQLQRWLQILLYATPGAQVDFDSPLLQLATTRGKLMELMARKMAQPLRGGPEAGFTVGIMSLMDALFSMSMQDILETVAVAPDVRAALLEREGALGEMLKIVELLENPKRGTQLGKLLKPLGISVKDMREIELDAFSWVNELVA